MTTHWAVEEIPGTDYLYMWGHHTQLKDGELQPGVFRDRDGGMSTDWSKYSTPEDTRNRARIPNDNGIVSLTVDQVREIEGLKVEHSPIPDNRAHTDVIGKKTPEVRMKLLRIFEWAIEL